MTTQIENPTQFRKNIRVKFAGMFDTMKSSLDADTEKLASNLEKGVYNYAIQEANFRKIVKKWENGAFVQLYLDRLRTIYTNLKTNPDLAISILQGEILPQSFAFMTHQEMNPGHWAEIIERLTKRNASKYTDNMEASTDMFTCRKCKGKRCTYYEMQTRSADEPATIFITCLDCKNHWRM
jgi:transcription elongation factor S-II